MLGKLSLFHRRWHTWVQHRLKTLHVDFAVTGQPNYQRVRRRVGQGDSKNNVLQRIRCRPRTVGERLSFIGMVD